MESLLARKLRAHRGKLQVSLKSEEWHEIHHGLPGELNGPIVQFEVSADHQRLVFGSLVAHEMGDSQSLGHGYRREGPSPVAIQDALQVGLLDS